MIRISARTASKVLGVVLILVGFFLLSQSATITVPRIYASTLTETVDCGRAIDPNSQATPDRTEACSDKLAGPKTAGFIVGGVGLVILLGAFLVAFPARHVDETTA